MFAYEWRFICVCLRFSTGRMRAQMYEIVCILKGGFLSISMHLLQIVSIYLFIFPRREKCVCGDMCEWLLIVYYFKPRQ